MPSIEEKNLSVIEVNPSSTPKHSVIWLHGLGADGNDFVPIVPELRLPNTLDVRFVFPHAPVMPVTINQGAHMRAWFDISPEAFSGQIDMKGIERSMAQVEQLIEHEVKLGIPTSNIILAGFSQGAVIALTTGLRYSKPLAGILALSGCLIFADEFIRQTNAANRQIPIFIAHGDADIVVPYALGKATYVALQQAGLPISWHSYPMGHTVSAPEVSDISQWMQSILK